MNRSLVVLIFLFLFKLSFAQNDQSWGAYFSYKGITDVSNASNAVFAVSENAVFSKNIDTDQVKIKNTLDGLSGQTITSLYHSQTFNKTFLGYQNGLMIIVNEADGTIRQFVDIINKELQPNLKKINHFYEYEEKIYISCDFGIVQFNLNTLEFGDTYFIGNAGAETAIMQTTVFDGFIYAATRQNGIRRANITSPNLINYQEWQEINSGWFVGVDSYENRLLAADNSGNIHQYNGINFQFFQNAGNVISDIRGANSYGIVTTSGKINIYNSQLILVQTINAFQITEHEVKFTCATIIDNKVYAGTLEHGMVIFLLNNVSSYQFFSPDGPERNTVFAVNAQTENLWLAFGGFASDYNPYTYIGFDLTKFGISKFSNNTWTNIPFEDLLGARALSKIIIDPANPNTVFISSYHDGILKIENDIATHLYTYSNTGTTGLESLIDPLNPNYKSVRVYGTAFDRSGNLWMNNANINKPIKVLRANNQWNSYSVENTFTNPRDIVYDELVIDRSDRKWIATYGGVLGFDDKTNMMKLINNDESGGNLPSSDVRALAIDNKNQLWIGTNRGLRILSSVDRFNSDDVLKSNPIIILEEGLAQELLYQQFITDIVVDGANTKWIGTADAGVFHVSSDGQQILHQFNINNSPLPSNSINDIDINPSTGEVFFATPKGLVSYKGISTKGADDLSNVIVYPNPVRPEYHGTVKITGLLDKANVKITDIQGNLVFETTTEGGTIEWDTTAFGKYKVATGVYMIFIASQDAAQTKIKKVMIVR